MSEITAEQVERAMDAAYDCNAQGVNAALGAFWYEREDIPADVRDGWRQVGYLGLRIALTRWHAELAAAEPARRVARWDAELEAYALTPIHDDGALMTHAVEDAAKARDWGYEIEGGPEPVRDWKSDRAIAAIWPIQPAEDSPERLRERREGIPWTLNEAAAAVSKTPSRLIGGCVPWQAADVSLCEGKSFAGPAYAQCRALYAAALSAEEARLAAEGADRVIAAIGRPTPRFKVGEWVRVHNHASTHYGTVYRIAEVSDIYYRKTVGSGVCSYSEENLEPASPPAPEVVPRGWSRHSSGSYWCLHCNATGDAPGDQDCSNCGGLGWRGEPGSPPEPAPEVVDVPQPRQPIVKRCGGVAASWQPDGTCLFIDGGAASVHAPVALLRAMLAAIDAQQGGAS